MPMRIPLWLLLVLIPAVLLSQSPAKKRLLLSGGMVQRTACADPERLDVLIEDDRIAAVGLNLDATGAESVDASGLFIAPAFIDAGHLGLIDETALRGGASDLAADMLEAHDLRVRTQMALAGIGLVYADLPLRDSPRGPVGCLIMTASQQPSPRVFERLAGVSFGVGTRVSGQAARLGRSAEVAALGEALSAARRYRSAQEKHAKDLKEFEAKQAKAEKPTDKNAKKALPPQAPRKDESAEAMLRVVDRKLPLRVEAHWREDIEAVLELAEKQGVKLTLLGAGEAESVAERLAAAQVTVVLGPPEPLMESALLAPQRSARLAAKLNDAGVTLAFLSTGARGFREDSLPLIAALHVAQGLPEAAALRGLTSGAASALGISGSAGSIEPGRLALLQLRKTRCALDGSRAVRLVEGTTVIRCGAQS